MERLRFSWSPPVGDRRHHLTEEDVRFVLSRLPEEVTARLRAVHFNDGGMRLLGYVNRGRREIAICALPPRMSLTRKFADRDRRGSPRRFGAVRGAQWPLLAVRRYLLYSTLLHELGHLQVVRPRARSQRLRFAREPRAQSFADAWRERLWSAASGHPDPVHDPPGAAELELVERVLRLPLRGEDRLRLADLLDFHFWRIAQGTTSELEEVVTELASARVADVVRGRSAGRRP
ncbi:MAG: hypothetical protein M9894_02120 [Planctomycetes bacterium]|nr:hypothetical protein [Planctomycetota bacterium]